MTKRLVPRIHRDNTVKFHAVGVMIHIFLYATPATILYRRILKKFEIFGNIIEYICMEEAPNSIQALLEL